MQKQGHALGKLHLLYITTKILDSTPMKNWTMDPVSGGKKNLNRNGYSVFHGCSSFWIPSQYRRWINIIRYWNRVLSFECERITRNVFEVDCNRCRKIGVVI